MSSEVFSPRDWIDRLAQAIAGLAEAQKPYLREYWEYRPSVQGAFGEWDGNVRAFALGDLRSLYGMAHHSKGLGEEERYAPLRVVLDRARHILIAHPTLARVIGPIVGKDDFWVQILNAGSSTSPMDLIAGLMARASVLPVGGYRAAVAELHGLLTPAGEDGSEDVPGELDIGYDAVLFYGLTLSERVDVAGRHDAAAVRGGAAVRGRESGGGARPGGCRIPRVAFGRGGGKAVPVAAFVATDGPRGGACS